MVVDFCEGSVFNITSNGNDSDSEYESDRDEKDRSVKAVFFRLLNDQFFKSSDTNFKSNITVFFQREDSSSEAEYDGP